MPNLFENHLPESDLSTTGGASQDTTAPQQSSDFHLEVGGDLELSDYVGAVPASRKTGKDLEDWVDQRREKARAKLVTWSVSFFSCSLLAAFVLMGAMILHPEVNQSAVKDLLSLVINAQTPLLVVAFGYYFLAKSK